MLGTILLIAACVSFGLAAFGASIPRVALVPLGLFLWTLSLLIGGLVLR